MSGAMAIESALLKQVIYMHVDSLTLW